MMPLLYWTIANTLPEAVPTGILDYLHRDFEATAQRNLQLTNQLLSVMRSLNAKGIQAIPFKGPEMAASIYGNVAFRQFGDLDILIRERDVSLAATVFAANGFAKLPTHYAHEIVERRFSYHYPFAHGDTIVEVHWAFAAWRFGRPIDLNVLWRRLQLVQFAGTIVPHLTPEDLLVVLSVHGAKHRWQKLVWVCDVAALVRAYPELDFAYAMKHVRARGSERMLILALLLAHEVLNTNLPENVRQWMHADADARAVAMDVQKQLFRRNTLPSDGQKERLFDLRLRERLSDRIQYLARIAVLPNREERPFFPAWARWYLVVAVALTPNERDWAWLSLPTPLAFLYYAIRPMRLLGKHAFYQLKRVFS